MPRRGIRVAPACIPKIKQALRRHGFPSQNALAVTLGLSRATITSFFTGKAIDYTNFVEICERLGLDWQAIAYIEEETSPPAPPPPLEGCRDVTCNVSTPFPARDGGQGGLGLDWRQVSQEMLKAQNQQRLTTNPLTAGDGLTFELDQIYVPLGLVERKQRQRRIGDISPEEGSRIYEPETADEITQTFQNNEFFEQVLRPGKSKRIAMIGEPGAGKTTLLQKIASWVIDNTADVPVWISLADLQGKTIEEYLLSNWLRSAPRKVRVTPEMEEALGELFNSKRVWLLLDGVDEMVAESGHALAQISKQLTGWVSDARVVLTCRLNVWDAGKNALENFETYRNLDFSYGDAQTPDQVGQFIRCWFQDKPALAERLRTELDKSGRERIKDAVKNPLRLALLCRIWTLGQGGLPDTKAGLYRRFVEALYDWKQEQFPTSSTQRQELNQTLGELAKRAIAEEKTKFRLRHRLVREILGEPDAKLFKLALQLGFLNQAGVLAETKNLGEKIYAFYHPTFQEYFAAQAINDWYYFLNHTPYNPQQGIYRIFEPQWKEVILLWLGREDVLKARKDELLKALIDFEDECKEFYQYQAGFLAAAGIYEFADCSLADEVVYRLIKWGFGYFEPQRQTRVQFHDLVKEAAKEALQKTESKRAVNALVVLINSTQDERIHLQAAETLGRIGFSNMTAIQSLIKLARTGSHQAIRLTAVVSLGQIGNDNSEAIKALMQLAQTAEDRFIRRLAEKVILKINNSQTPIQSNQSTQSLKQQDSDNSVDIPTLIGLAQAATSETTQRVAIENLGKVGKQNPLVIQTLSELIDTSDSDLIRATAATSLGKIDPGNPIAIRLLIQLVQTANRLTLAVAADSLRQIIPADGLHLAVSALKNGLLTEQVYEDDFGRYDACYKVVWYCAQQMTYPVFYQAWHSQPSTPHPEVPETTKVGFTPLTQSLNLAELPRLLATAVALDTDLNQNIKLICIDNSKFIDPDNPASKIYVEMVKCGCPKSHDYAPKTMIELQTYWDLLKIDKHIVLVFYNDPAGAKRQEFSAIFLSSLSKFDGAICVVTEQVLDISLQRFWESQPMLIEDIIGWIKLSILEA